MLCYDRQDEPPAISEQRLIGIGIMPAASTWARSNSTGPRQHVSRSMNSGPSLAQHVALVRLALQQLLGDAAVSYGSSQVP